jgi:hypothetical protein
MTEYMNNHSPQIRVQQFSVHTETWETIGTGLGMWLLVMDNPHYRVIDGKGQVCQSSFSKLKNIEEGAASCLSDSI